jgi:molybdopterin-binding protein
MREYKPGEAARLLGVSADTVRRWCDEGRIPTRRVGQQRFIKGTELARFLSEQAAVSEEGHAPGLAPASVRNRMTGIVTRVVKDKVAAQVELQCGQFRMVSLMTREAADELGLEPGSLAVASVKATNVAVEVPA